MTSETVKEIGIDSGASVVGIASSKDFVLAPVSKNPCDVMENCRSVIVLAIPFSRDALSKNFDEYTQIRNETYKKTDIVAKETAKRVKSKGYKATAIGGLSGKISLKHAAELAGIGVINRNYLLTNSEYGNLLWFSAVLTDAELIPDEKYDTKVCDNCNKCVKNCPAKALNNPCSFNKKECHDKCWKMENKKWKLNCFLCRKICPYGLEK